MGETRAEQLKREIDTSWNETLEAQEMEEFLKSDENIKKLWEAMNNDISPELLQEMESSLKDLCENFLQENKLSENQQKIVNYFLDKFWNKYPELMEKKQEYSTRSIENKDDNNGSEEALNQEIELRIIENYENLEEQDKQSLSELLQNFKWTLNEKIENYLDSEIDWGKNEAENEKILQWINVLNSIIKIDQTKTEKLKSLVQKRIEEIWKVINKRIAKNETSNFYDPKDIMTIQLWANVFYWENLKIDGKKDGIYGVNSENSEWITNIYIYRFELKTRWEMMNFRKDLKMKEFGNLLNIPNLDNQLALLSEKTQNEILEKFLDFFLKIKQWWMYFENNVWKEKLQSVLNNLINAERYKNTSVEEYYNTYKVLMSFNEEITQEEIDQIEVEQAEIMWKYQTMWQCFEELANSNMQAIIQNDKNFRESNQQLVLTKKINEFYKIFWEYRWDPNKKEDLERLWKELLDDPKLQENQRKDLLMVLWWIFSEIQTEWNNKTIEGTEVYRWTPWNKVPTSIKYTPWCNIRIETDKKNIRTVSDESWKEFAFTDPRELRIFLDDKQLFPQDMKCEWYDIHIDENNQLIIRKLWWDGSKLKRIFWDKIYEEYQVTKSEINSKSKINEWILDIKTQLESDTSVDIIGITEEEKEIINNEIGYTERLNYYNNVEVKEWRSKARDYDLESTPPTLPTPPEAPKYNQYYHLNIPWCEWKIVHIMPAEQSKINDAIAKYWDNLCFNPKDKSNRKIYELTLSDLNISEKDKDWNIHLYEINNEWNKWNEIETLSATELNEAEHINNLIITSVQMAPWLENAMKNASTINNDVEKINKLYKKFNREEWSENEDGSKWLTWEDVQTIRYGAYHMLDCLSELTNHHNDFVQLRKWLTERYSWESNISREDEMMMKSYIDNLDYIINATVKWWDIDNFCQTMLNAKNVHSNDKWRERVWWRFRNNWMKVISSIAWWVAAVCLAPVSWWWSLVLLKMAMVMTAWWMAWWFMWQGINEQVNRRLTKPIVLENWETIQVRYDDPTSLESAIKWDMSRKNFAMETWVQFIMWTALLFDVWLQDNIYENE